MVEEIQNVFLIGKKPQKKNICIVNVVRDDENISIII